MVVNFFLLNYTMTKELYQKLNRNRHRDVTVSCHLTSACHVSCHVSCHLPAHSSFSLFLFPSTSSKSCHLFLLHLIFTGFESMVLRLQPRALRLTYRICCNIRGAPRYVCISTCDSCDTIGFKELFRLSRRLKRSFNNQCYYINDLFANYRKAQTDSLELIPHVNWHPGSLFPKVTSH